MVNENEIEVKYSFQPGSRQRARAEELLYKKKEKYIRLSELFYNQ